jgi:hypothetical protein
MGPRVVGIDGRGELAEETFDALVVLPFPIAREREAVLRAVEAVDEVVRRRAGDRGVRGVERQSELVHEPQVGRVSLPDELAAELHGALVVDGDLLDAAPDAVARLEHEDVCAAGGQIPGRRKAGEPGPENEDVPHVASSTAAGAGDSTSTRRASRGRCALTRSPSRTASSSPAFVTSACNCAADGRRRCSWVVEPR